VITETPKGVLCSKLGTYGEIMNDNKMSCIGRGLFDGLITRPEESYRVSKYMRDHRNPERGPMFQVGDDRKMNDE
jgi:hypothetical protein